MTTNNLTEEQNALLEQYFKLQKQFRELKDSELSERNNVLEEIFDYSDSDLRKGTETIELSEHWKVKATFKKIVKLSYENDELELAYNEVSNVAGVDIANGLINVSVGFDQELFDALSNEDKALIANKCFKNHYSLNVENYEKLEGNAKTIFSSVVEEKSSQPTLTFAETKKKGRKK